MGQTPEARGTTVLQPAEQRPQTQKVRQNEMAEDYVPDEEDRTPEEQLSEVEISNLPEKEFRVMIVKMTQGLRNRMEVQTEKIQEIFNKELEDLKNKQTEMNNRITEMKNTVEGINGRINGQKNE